MRINYERELSREIEYQKLLEEKIYEEEYLKSSFRNVNNISFSEFENLDTETNIRLNDLLEEHRVSKIIMDFLQNSM